MYILLNLISHPIKKIHEFKPLSKIHALYELLHDKFIDKKNHLKSAIKLKLE